MWDYYKAKYYLFFVSCFSGQHLVDRVLLLWKVIWAQQESWLEFKQTTLSSSTDATTAPNILAS